MARSEDLWATRIECMTPRERANCGGEFGPFVVSPDGHLRLPIELLLISDRSGQWLEGPSRGWIQVPTQGGDGERRWCALGWEFLFDGSRKKHVKVHAGSSADQVRSWNDIDNALAHHKAFAFDGQVFFLPNETDFVMNSFQYHVQDMDPLTVFVGYRGQTQPYPETLSPGLYRTRNNPTQESKANWSQKSRVAANVLKQRFFEAHNKPLTEIEAVGIMQHHYLVGVTDLLDLTFDVNIAKWFALNKATKDGKYEAKQFVPVRSRKEAERDASRIVCVAVRPIGTTLLSERDWNELNAGVSPRLWEGYAKTEELSQFQTPPSNLAPLWSEYPRRQRGFGLRGIGPKDTDQDGAVLAVWEYLYHPCYFSDGWHRLGGMKLTLDGKEFTEGEDSSSMSRYLFPDHSEWFKATREEVTRTVNQCE